MTDLKTIAMNNCRSTEKYEKHTELNRGRFTDFTRSIYLRQDFTTASYTRVSVSLYKTEL